MEKGGLKFIGMVVAVLLVIYVLIYFRSRNAEDPVLPFENSWEEAVAFQQIPEGLVSLSAEDCGVCHTAHYEEWKNSTHAWAWKDEQFQAEIRKESSPYLCINCHIPLENQQEWIVEGLTAGDVYRPVRHKNKRFDRKLQQEGITCAACHVRNNAIIGPTGSVHAPHKTIKDPEFLSESLCISCHNAVASVTPQLACSFETGDEWNAGPYPGKKNCISCHMEETERALVQGYEVKKSHYHGFSGSGIPKDEFLDVQMLQSLEIELESVAVIQENEQGKPFTLRIKNAHAGHRVPTGDPERFILIRFRVYDSQGKVVKEKTERIGEKWKWYPVAKKISDNNLNPLEERVYKLNPDGLKAGKYRLLVTMTKYRTTQKTADYNKLSSSYPIKAEMYRKEVEFSVL